MKPPPTISVCVCTFRRAQLLAALLDSLAAQTFPLEEFEVIVVDNDPAASGRESVAMAQQRWPRLRLIYDTETQPGISFARNRTVALASGRNLAFIDDDETASSQWLHDLMHTLETTGADAVLGPVLPFFPVGSHAWAEKSGFFDRPRYNTGDFLHEDEGRTSNAMVVARRARKRGAEVFSARFARSGGEDHDFFKWLTRCGGQMVWCDTAVVNEVVPLSRQTLSFMLERSFRTAATYWSGKYAEHSWAWNMAKAAQGAIGGSVLLAIGALQLAISKHRATRRLCKAFRAYGRVGALLRLSLEHYGS